MRTKHVHEPHEVDHEEHRRTCVVCKTLGVKRTNYEFKVREFTPAGEIIELTIMQTREPLEDQDIRWVLEHAILQIESKAEAQTEPVFKDSPSPPTLGKLIWTRAIMFVLIALLLVVLFQHLPL